MFASDTKSDVLPLGRKPYACSVVLVSLRACSCWPVHVNVEEPAHLLPPVFVIMFRKTPEVGTVMSCAPGDTGMSSTASKSQQKPAAPTGAGSSTFMAVRN